jgi:hypothetical protein
VLGLGIVHAVTTAIVRATREQVSAEQPADGGAFTRYGSCAPEVQARMDAIDPDQ